MVQKRVRVLALTVLALSVGAPAFCGWPGRSPFVSAAHAKSPLGTLIQRLRGNPLPSDIAGTNGRLEAEQVDVASKYAGRLADVSVDEGDLVTLGQVVGRVDSPETLAQLRGAQAQVAKAEQALTEATADIAQRESARALARADFQRGEELVGKGYLTRQVFDQRRDAMASADQAYNAAVAQRDQAQSAILSAQAEVDRLQAMLHDLVLVAPRDGRVQYQLLRSGEIVAAGSRVLTILDLQNVYMTIYLPASQAGKVAIGDDARLILDPIPQFVIPAKITFVAADAQFTPKSVETQEERDKLMFRLKIRIDPNLLAKYRAQVKTGVRGRAFVRLGQTAAWPANLAVTLPQ